MERVEVVHLAMESDPLLTACTGEPFTLPAADAPVKLCSACANGFRAFSLSYSQEAKAS